MVDRSNLSRPLADLPVRRLATWVALLLVVLSGTVGLQAAPRTGKFTTGYDNPVVEFANEEIRRAWVDNEVTASDVADDAEWVRRVHLDIVGHIPPANVVESFITSKDEAKRSKMVEQLLADPGYVRNLTTVWTNLLLGRATPDRTSRSGMEKFLREGFARNRPWNDMVFDVLASEGHFEENGAVNFLLGQLQGNPDSDEYAVEATAKATRVFLGMQVQCTQCHNHPFNDWKQNQFWEFNSFFRQMIRVDHDRYDPKSGRREDDYSELAPRDFGGAVYYETRSGLVQVAYPKYFDKAIEEGGQVNRREELAKLMTRNDGNKLVAKAMVNRMWGHFFGYGFTRPVDDMGPHNPASHPELLDRLTDEFITANYDIKQLVRWIANTEAYSLTSQVNKTNENVDNPAAGEAPLFSHMYVKPLQVEQLYDSLMIATQADAAGAYDFDQAQQRRDRTLRQFMSIFAGNDEDEPTMFNGTIPQALLLMNGELVQSAIKGEPGSFLHAVLNNARVNNDADRVRTLYLAALGRPPQPREAKGLQKLIQVSPNKLTAYQDIYWALLNSNEFVLNH